MTDRFATARRCPHPHCVGERWCLLNTAVGLPDDIPACTCAYATDKVEHHWHLPECAFTVALLVLLPEPPDGTRIEFEHCADVEAAHRHDDSSRRAGWPFGDGGATWLMYGHSVPWQWARMIAEYGPEPLRLAIRLLTHPDDAGKREQWPTQIWYRSLPRFEIDPNVRVNDNQTYAPLDSSEHEIGDDVILFESEDSIEWDGKIASYNFTRGLVYFDVEWESVRSMAGALTAES